ncbi:MAG: IS5 family transposase [Candidatus Thorarchaeota archaeon]
MTYYTAYDTARSRHPEFLLDTLINLSNMLPSRTSRRGRPPTFPLPALCVLLALKSESQLSYRDFVAQLLHRPLLLRRLGLPRPPSYSTLQQALRRIDPEVLHRMCATIAHRRPPPRCVAVDSTGFSHPSGGEWLEVRMERRRRRRFTALHAVIDTESLMFLAVRVRTRPGGDARELIPLLRRIRHDALEYVYADRAYHSRENIQCIFDLGAYPAIEPKRGLSGRARGYRGYREQVREYQRGPEEWKEAHRYGRRSLVETVFSTMKVHLTGGLSSRGEEEQVHVARRNRSASY